MPDEKMYSVRLEPGFERIIEDLRHAWGKYAVRNTSDVIRESLRRAHENEARKKNRRKPAETS